MSTISSSSTFPQTSSLRRMFVPATHGGSRIIQLIGVLISTCIRIEPLSLTRLCLLLFRTPENCPYTPLEYPACLSHGTAITPHSPGPYSLLNGGVVVLTPSRENAHNVSRFLHTSPLVSTFKFPDQDFLAELFRGRWHPLPWVYNALKSLRFIHPEIWRDEDVRCVHYIMAEKPWIAPRPSDPEVLEAPPSPAGSSTASLSSSDDALSVDSDSLSTPATSPSTSQLDVRLGAGSNEDDTLAIEPKSMSTCSGVHLRTSDELGSSWMGESENELLRWWWVAFDKLERESIRASWWPLVEANVIGGPGARY